jgi:hypothetical protein
MLPSLQVGTGSGDLTVIPLPKTCISRFATHVCVREAIYPNGVVLSTTFSVRECPSGSHFETPQYIDSNVRITH